jgi:hypothetical protein
LATALWLHVGYEPDAGSHRVAITVPGWDGDEPAPLFRLHIGHGQTAGPSQVDSYGFVWDGENRFSPPGTGGVATYSGPTGSVAHIEWWGGAAPGPVVISVDGRPVTSIDPGPDDSGVESLDFALSTPPAAYLLLVALVGWMTLAARWLLAALEARISRGGPRALARPVGLAALGAAVLMLTVPVDAAATGTVSIEATPLGPSPLGSAGSEVWLRVVGGDGRTSPSAELGHPQWVSRPPFVVGDVGDQPMRATVAVSPDDRIELASLGHAGLVELSVDGRRDVIDTFAGAAVIDIGAWADPSGVESLLGGVSAVLTFVALAHVLLLVGLVVAERVRPPTRATTHHWLVPQAIWTTALIVWWPGIMSPDSLSQWFQLEQGALTNWHPYTTTILIGLTRLIVDSPWLAILLTISATSAALGGLATRAARAGCPSWVITVSLLMASASPALLLMGVVLWKDVIMGAALLTVTFVVWNLLEDDRWLTKRWWHSGVAVTALAMVWLSRHNGWPVVLATLGLLAVVRPRLRRPVGLLAAAVVTLALVVTIPLARALDVTPNPTGGIAFLQRVSAHVNAGTELSEQDRAFLSQLRPLDQPWPYDCASVQPTWAGPDAIPVDSYQGRDGELLRLAATLAIRNPRVELSHLRCSSRIVWQMTERDSSTFLVEHGGTGALRDTIPTWFTQSPMERHASRSLASRSLDVVMGLPSPFHRPAPYLVALALSVVAATVRRRSLDPVLLASPALFQVASIGPFILVQDSRFLYGAMVVSAVLTPMLLSAEARTRPGQPLSWKGAFINIEPQSTDPIVDLQDDASRSKEILLDHSIHTNG